MPSDNPPGDCAPHAARAAALLEALGFVVERHVVPDAAVKANGMVSCTNLVVRVRFGAGDGPVIALNAHGDVVPPGSGWTTDPYGAEIRDGFMYGRGVAVSKSDFATYAFALLALRDAAARGAALAGTVELHFTYDEEVGGAIGPAMAAATEDQRARLRDFRRLFLWHHDGAQRLPASAGRCRRQIRPRRGAGEGHRRARGGDGNAVRPLCAAQDVRRRRRSSVPGIGSPTLVVGLIEGGINTNVVPDHVTFRIDRRIIPEENPAEVEATLTRQIHEFAAKWPAVQVSVKRILLAVPFVPIPGQEKLVAALQRHGKAVLGEDLATHGVPIYTDARLYTTAGIPAVLYGAGPRTLVEANGHRADEKLNARRPPPRDGSGGAGIGGSARPATTMNHGGEAAMTRSRVRKHDRRGDRPAADSRDPRLWRTVSALGVAQIISWGTLFYTIAVLGSAMRRGPRHLRRRAVRQLHRGTVPVGSRVAARRPRDRRARRPPRARRGIAAGRAGHGCAGHGAGAGDDARRMAAGRRCDVGVSLRPGVRHAAPDFRHVVPPRGDRADALRRLRQHGVLAAFAISAR